MRLTVNAILYVVVGGSQGRTGDRPCQGIPEVAQGVQLLSGLEAQWCKVLEWANIKIEQLGFQVTVESLAATAS